VSANLTYKQRKKEVDSEKTSLIFWIIICFIIGFLAISPFQRALFLGYSFDFEYPINSLLLITGIILILVSIYLFLRWEFNSIKDLLSIGILFIPLTYFISSINGISEYYSNAMFYYNIIFATFFIIGANFLTNAYGSMIVRIAILFSGCLVVLFGFMNLFGDASFFGVFTWSMGKIYKDAVMGLPDNIRLASVFQYPNTYASFLIALLLSYIYTILTSRKWLYTFITGILLVPICLSLLLTLSRGGFVVLPLIILFILPFLKLYRQIFFIIYFVIALAASLSINNIILAEAKKVAEQNTVSLMGWSILILTSIIVSLLITGIHILITNRYEDSVNSFMNRKYSNFILPVVFIVVGSILGFIFINNKETFKFLPNDLYQRIEKINFNQHEVLERLTFYKDSLKLFKDYPIFGAGGGAWAAAYEHYQNNPYTSRQAHNFFLQYLDEVGVVGFSILIIIISTIIVYFIRNFIANKKTSNDHFIYYIIAISLLIHSILDFDMSFIYIEALTFLCLGGMTAGLQENKIAVSNFLQKWKKVYPGILLCLAIICCYTSIKLINSGSYYKAALSDVQTNQVFNNIMQKLDTALKYVPNHPEYNLLKIQLLNSAYNQTKQEEYYNQSIKLIEEMRQREPFSKTLIELQYSSYIQKGLLEQALNLLNANIKLFPWEQSMYDRAILISFDLGNTAREKQDINLMNKYWDNAESLYGIVLEQIKKLELLPKEQNQGRPFTITPNMSLALGQIYFMRGEYEKATEVLKYNLNNQFNDQTVKVITRYYLASLSKQDRTDQLLYDKFINSDPTEKLNIENLLKTKFF
jgi:tetratricopeptide (TPR) repeat protein